MVRCPTCLNRLVDGELKRCPECGARVTTRRRQVIPDDLITQRPRALVERELQARIEAQTAERFVERRRAAKAARRIAALPPSLWEAGAMIDDPVTWNSAPSIVIDLPTSAIHDLKPTKAPVVVPDDRDRIALVAPVIELAASAVDDREADALAASAPRRPGLFAATLERWRHRRLERDELNGEEHEEDSEVVARSAEPEPVIAPEPEPEPIVAREAEPEPLPIRPEPRGAVEWERSNSLWSNRVFNPRSQPVRYASWPREPAPRDDIARDYIDAQVRDE